MEKSLKTAILELKECLDAQIITQEEFEKTKAELLQNFGSRPILSPIQFADADDDPSFETHDTPLHSKKARSLHKKTEMVEEPMEVELTEPAEKEGKTNVQDFSAFLEEEISTSVGVMVSPSKIVFSEKKENESVEDEEMEEEKLNTSMTKQVETKNGIVNITTAILGPTQHPETEEESFSITDATVEQFWSIILQTPIPKGIYYPKPEDARERMRTPFLLAKAFIESLALDPHGDGLKSGGSLALRAFHTDVFRLKIPWCLAKVVRTKSEKVYLKAEDLCLDFYCP